MITNETLTIIKQRRSTRSFQDEQIKDDELQAILEAGRYAPYAWEQSRYFTVIQNKELLNRLNDAAKEAASQMDMEHLRELGNNEWFHCLYHAPTLIIVSGSELAPIPLEADCATATQNMLIAAESMGLGSCWLFFVLMAFESAKGAELRRELKIPDGYKPAYSAAFGYKTDETVVIPERSTDLIAYVK